jgi:hypothetical protein
MPRAKRQRGSSFITLEPGDVVFTGTPSGVIVAYPKEKQVWLKPGDRVRTATPERNAARLVFIQESPLSRSRRWKKLSADAIKKPRSCERGFLICELVAGASGAAAPAVAAATATATGSAGTARARTARHVLVCTGRSFLSTGEHGLA